MMMWVCSGDGCAMWSTAHSKCTCTASSLCREFNNNKDAWFVQKGKVVPSLEDVLKQAKGVRLLEEQRAYMRQYRVDKKNDSKVRHASA